MLYQDNKKTHRASGFTLIEVMVAVAIIGILAAVAWPVFNRYELKVSRADGIAGLKIAANEMETCAARSFDYTTCGLVNNTSPRGKYDLAIDAPNTTVTEFNLTATKAGGVDPECGVLSLNHLGQEDETGSKSVKFCWSK